VVPGEDQRVVALEVEDGGLADVVPNLEPRVVDLMEVQSDYRIITPSDLVSDPSAHGALMRGIMEGQEYFWDDTLGFYSEVTKKKINKMTVEQIEAKKIAIFENFIKEISGGTYLQYK
jgi:hypothetical protein